MRSTAPVPAGFSARGVSRLIVFVLACAGGACGGADSTTPKGSGGTTTPPPSSATASSVKFSSASPTLDRWGDTTTVVAHVLDEHGNTMSTKTVTYTSSDTAVVKVSPSGQLTSWKGGTATIAASGSGFADSLDVTVAIQRNSACMVPAAVGTPGPAAPPGTWSVIAGPTGSPEITGMVIPVDANGDGKLDVITVGWNPADRTTYASGVVAHINQGGATFVDGTAQVFGVQPSPFNGPRDYSVADVNGDGRLDIFVANPGFDPSGIDGKGCGDGVTICDGAPDALLLAQPTGGFQNVAATALSTNPANGFTHSADLADIDCDGDPDLFEGRWPNDHAPAPSALKTNAGGVFTVDNSRVTGWTITAAASGSAFCDLDGDGDVDLLVYPPLGNLRVLVNDGFGHFRALPESTMPAPRSPLTEAIGSDIGCADLDRDGRNDIVYHDHSFNANYDKWTVIHNTGNMTFANWNTLLPNPDATYFIPTGGGTTAMMHDFNGDGWMDMLSGDAGGPLRILWNTGGAFVEQTLTDQWGGTVYGSAAGVGDFNGDGKLDIFLDPGHGFPGAIEIGN